MSLYVAGRIMDPKDVHILIPRAHEHVKRHCKGDFTHVIKVRRLFWIIQVDSV